MSKKYGFSFSWKRLLGISGLKSKVSRKTGIPLTKSGLERKIGRTIINILLKNFSLYFYTLIYYNSKCISKEVFLWIK